MLPHPAAEPAGQYFNAQIDEYQRDNNAEHRNMNMENHPDDHGQAEQDEDTAPEKAAG
jgi:hypothetical protein